MEEAVAAFRQALQEFTRDRVPPDWAMTQANLGFALTTLGKRETGTTRLEEAIAALRESLSEFTASAAPHYHFQVQKQLEQAFELLKARNVA